MDYNRFKEELLKKLEEWKQSSDFIGGVRLYEKGMIADSKEDEEFIKSTNIKYYKKETDVLEGDFISVEVKKSNGTICRFDVHYLFESYGNDGWDFVKEIIFKNLNYSLNIDTDGVLKRSHDFDAVKDRLIIRPLNYSDNRLGLTECVYKRVGDMALVLYFYINRDDVYGLTTVKVHKDMFDNWGKDFDEIMELALINSNVIAVPRMYNSPEDMINPRYEVGAYMALGATCKLDRVFGGSTFTTYSSTNGAISFWYPGVAEKLAEMSGGDYYVAFTGIHDFHIHPVGSMSPRSVLSGLKNMNKKMNKEGETLSRKVYQYICATKELKMLEL